MNEALQCCCLTSAACVCVLRLRGLKAHYVHLYFFRANEKVSYPKYSLKGHKSFSITATVGLPTARTVQQTQHHFVPHYDSRMQLSFQHAAVISTRQRLLMGSDVQLSQKSPRLHKVNRPGEFSLFRRSVWIFFC